MKHTFSLHLYSISGLALLLLGCGGPKSPITGFPSCVTVPYEQDSVEGVPFVHVGGYGSSMAYHEADSTFWLLTDRGPNADGPTSESKVFLLSEFTPRVGIFKLKGDSLHLQRIILLKDSTNTPFNGLPRVKGDGTTGETAYDLHKHIIPPSEQYGLDPEGLALAPDGSFWVSDEYGPYLLHFDPSGRCMEEFSPFNGKLPAVYAHRRPNRGMEGLCISRDGSTLYGIMQSPLRLPKKESSFFSSCLPLFALHAADGLTRQYAYPLEDKDNGVSELAFAGRDTLLVLERDGKFPSKGKGFKRIYRVCLAEETDSIHPLRKELVVDLLKAVPDYDHDKPEGIALIGDSILAVVNDDDFGVSSLPDGSPSPKMLKNGKIDRNEIYCLVLI